MSVSTIMTMMMLVINTLMILLIGKTFGDNSSESANFCYSVAVASVPASPPTATRRKQAALLMGNILVWFSRETSR